MRMNRSTNALSAIVMLSAVSFARSSDTNLVFTQSGESGFFDCPAGFPSGAVIEDVVMMGLSDPGARAASRHFVESILVVCKQNGHRYALTLERQPYSPKAQERMYRVPIVDFEFQETDPPVPFVQLTDDASILEQTALWKHLNQFASYAAGEAIQFPARVKQANADFFRSVGERKILKERGYEVVSGTLFPDLDGAESKAIQSP